jgi:hypothetical protein
MEEGSEAAPEMTYFSEAQASRSRSWQRSLQNGIKVDGKATGFLQMGHFISKPRL